MKFDRRVSQELLDVLVPGGALAGVVELRNENTSILDVQLRRPSATDSRATLYAGLTAILKVDECNGLFSFSAHETHRKYGALEGEWPTSVSKESLRSVWPKLETYLRVLLDGNISKRYLAREGRVSASLSSGQAHEFRAIQREAQISYPSKVVRSESCEAIAKPIKEALATIPDDDQLSAYLRGLSTGFNLKADVLAVDPEGRLLVMEVKPADEAGGIIRAPAQVRFYAEAFALVFEQPSAIALLNEMLHQRMKLQITADGCDLPDTGMRIVPVVAIGPGPLSSGVLAQLQRLNAMLPPPTSRSIDEVEVWLIDEAGQPLDRWFPSQQDAPPTPASWPTSFSTEARAAAAEWKQTLLKEARADASYRSNGPEYPFCLPAAHAELNLLPEARAVAKTRFDAAKISWHHGIDSGPTNHLVSSQVQCVNALAPYVEDATELAARLRKPLDVQTILPFGATPSPSPYDHVVFEWVGERDYLNEHPGHSGTRGANNTSADAGLRYLTSAGTTVLALVEWKYTERYLGSRLHGGDAKTATRLARYLPLWNDPTRPFNDGQLELQDFFVEPFYQLLRLQLLAWKLEQDPEVDAERVRLVYMAPVRNAELWRSFELLGQRLHIDREPAESSGEYGQKVWRSLLVQPDRFVWIDTAAFIDEADADDPNTFSGRYRHLVDVNASDDSVPGWT